MLGLPLYVAIPALLAFWLVLALLVGVVIGTAIDFAEHWDDEAEFEAWRRDCEMRAHATRELVRR